MIDIKNLESEVGVIIPTLNEEKTIGSIIKRSLSYTSNVIVIDGWSDDSTLEVAKKMGAQTLIQNSRGKGAALKEAFTHVTDEIIVILDGDGSMRPEEIPMFLKGIYSGADVVKGSRFIDGGYSDDINMLRRFGNAIFTLLVNIIWKSNFTDLCYGYMAFRKDAIKKINPLLCSNGFAIETEIIIKAKKLGLTIREVPSFEIKRFFGESKLNTFKDGWKIFLTICKEAFI